MAHVTTPRWLSPVSRRIVVIVIAAAAALMLLTSILITSASAADPVRVRNVKGDACRALGFGVDAFSVVIPRGDADANYSRTFDLPNGGELTLSAPPNRSRVNFSMTGATADGGILFNRTDQRDGNLYDYRPEGGATVGILEPPPRDQGSEKQVVFCFGTAPGIDIDVTTNGADGLFIPLGAPVAWTYLVTNTGDVTLTNVSVADSVVTGITCPVTTLAVGAQTTCSATGTAAAGQFNNTGTVTALFGDVEVSAFDSSSYFGSAPAISVDATTNGADGLFIPVGDPVTWSYLVTNTGNVSLTNVGVTDDAVTDLPDVTGISCDDDELAPDEDTTCTATGTAETSAIGVFFTNTGIASGTPLVGAPVTSTDGSSYFGYVASFEVEVELVFGGASYDPGGPFPVILAGEPVTWRFTATNTGNVPVTATIVAEVDGESETTVCTLGDIPPGDVEGRNPATCDYDTTADDGETTTSFKVIGTDPNENEVTETIENVGYFGGLGCGANVRSATGDDVRGDGPDVWFYVGPVSDEALECGTAVEVTAELLDSQVANIVAPEGYPFIGTGIVTITWDAILRDDEPLVRTRQLDAGGAVIEQCAVVIPIVPDEEDEGFFELEVPDALYEAAVDFDGNGTVDGDICLIQQFNYQVAVGSVVYMQLQEVFYIWNDPILSRPR